MLLALGATIPDVAFKTGRYTATVIVLHDPFPDRYYQVFKVGRSNRKRYEHFDAMADIARMKHPEVTISILLQPEITTVQNLLQPEITTVQNAGGKDHMENEIDINNIYDEAKKLGVEIDYHESDLYIPVTPETKELVRQYKSRANVTTFKNQLDHKPWYDIPFAYSPFWDKVTKESNRRKKILASVTKEWHIRPRTQK